MKVIIKVKKTTIHSMIQPTRQPTATVNFFFILTYPYLEKERSLIKLKQIIVLITLLTLSKIKKFAMKMNETSIYS